MKALYCQDCGTVTTPYAEEFKAKACDCGRHAIWWSDTAAGVIQVLDTHYPSKAGPPPFARAAYVLNLHNGIFTYPEAAPIPTRDFSLDILARTPDQSIFKMCRSLVYRVRPGQDKSFYSDPIPLPAEREGSYSDKISGIAFLAETMEIDTERGHHASLSATFFAKKDLPKVGDVMAYNESTASYDFHRIVGTTRPAPVERADPSVEQVNLFSPGGE